MIAIVNGERGSTVNYIRGSDKTLYISLLADNGQPIGDITGETVTLEIHKKRDRSDTAQSIAAVLDAPTAGQVSVALDDAGVLADDAAGKAYAWVKKDDGSNGILFSKEFTILNLQ